MRDRKERKDINLHGNTLSVNGSQVGVFEEGDEVSLRSFLKGHDGGRLEAQVGLQSTLLGRTC